jgi:hypothetical protein
MDSPASESQSHRNNTCLHKHQITNVIGRRSGPQSDFDVARFGFQVYEPRQRLLFSIDQFDSRPLPFDGFA